MTPHANDPMGKAAHDAALAVSGMDLWLLAASSPTLDRESRGGNLMAALKAWPALCRAMSALEQAAPTISRKASEEAEQLRAVMERQGGVGR